MMDYLLPILILVFIFAFVRIISTRAKSKGCGFDERQELIRGRAFKYAFFSILIYVASYGPISALLEKDFMTTSTALFVGIFIALIVFAVYNIWNESFFALKQTPINFILLFSITAICSGYSGICSIRDGSIMENGLLTLECMSVVASIAFAIIVITMLIKIIINKKAEQEG